MEDIVINTGGEYYIHEIKNILMQEMTMLTQKNHPNLLRYIGVSSQINSVFLIAENVSGGTLTEQVDQYNCIFGDIHC